MNRLRSYYLLVFATLLALAPYVSAQDLTVGTPLTNQTLAANATGQYRVFIPSYCNNIIIYVNQTNTFSEGDPDLYVSTVPSWPQFGKSWAAAAYGSEYLKIPFDDIEYITGTYYLNIVNYCDAFNVSCTAITFDILVVLEEVTNPASTVVTLGSDEVYYQSICVPNNCTIFKLSAFPQDDSGDPDLYASNTVNRPDIFLNYLWVSAVNGSGTPEYLSVSNKDPEYTPGVYYIALHNFCSVFGTCGNSTFNLTVQTFAAECPPVVATGLVNGTELTSGVPLRNITLASQVYSKPYRINIPDICQDLNVQLTQTNTIGNGDVDLYISKLSLYPTYGKAWSSLNTGSENFTLSHEDPDYQAGWLYLYAYNYCDNDTALCTEASYDLTATVLPLDETVHNKNNPSLTVASREAYFTTICASPESPGICIKVAARTGNPDIFATNKNPHPHSYDALWAAYFTGEGETEILFISNEDPQFTLGTYWIVVFNGGENLDANITISSTLTREQCFGSGTVGTTTAAVTGGTSGATAAVTGGTSGATAAVTGGTSGATAAVTGGTSGATAAVTGGTSSSTTDGYKEENSANKMNTFGAFMIAVASFFVMFY